MDLAILGKIQRAGVAPLVGLLIGLLSTSCIFPDRDIDIIYEGENPSPVRVVEPTNMSIEASCTCDLAQDLSECSYDEPPLPCPMPEDSLLHLLPKESNFCICPDNLVDANRLPAINFFIEDQDKDDEIFAALMIDSEYSPFYNLPTPEYRNYLDPNTVRPDRGVSEYQNNSPLRPTPYLRTATASDLSAHFDLCNGTAVPLEEGWHQLKLIVTDRPWFSYTAISVDGTENTVTQEGVPDIAGGSTYDQQYYSFYCHGPESESCDCRTSQETP